MKNKFILGAIAGMSTITLAVPVLAQITSAASTTTSTGAATSASPKFKVTRGPLTQEKLQEMIDRDTAFLTNADAILALHKSATTAHKAALTAALSLTDDTAREAAVKKANEDMRATMEAAITANPALKGAMMPMGKPGFGGPGGRGHGPEKGDLAAKLGMTEAELKAAIEGGKTIEQIATEKGITLPARPPFMGRGHGEQDAMSPQDN